MVSVLLRANRLYDGLVGLKAFTAAILGGIGEHPRSHDRQAAAHCGVIRRSARRIAMAWKDAIAFLVLILILSSHPWAHRPPR